MKFLVSGSRLRYLIGALFSLQDHSRFVNSVRYSPDGELFVSGGAEGKVSGSFWSLAPKSYLCYFAIMYNI